ncbi:DUF2493 domain-containing protein [Pseudomonas sp. zfem003]|uniref:DUF2493 domain-containing protein n=1 Tax=Pseudomonas sp. zfem003 TaxID=3078198 RepID=UPI0029291CAB|nr:DUF2493 domain-containing protein [Pseudomonas sp. zfem003]MDU9398049.1 DUF2493 domain-containing protein [Pseudomonas sp. zfem003]
MKLLVCGGRDYADRRYLYAVLDAVHEKCGIRIVIHGNAPGADTLAGEWAAERGIHAAVVQALWDVHGKAAGPRRNEAMLLLAPDGVLAFPGGRGTDGMVALAESAGITVMDQRGRG